MSELTKVLIDIARMAAPSAPVKNIHGKTLGECDACGKWAVLRATPITYAPANGCAECFGGLICPKCFDDIGYCECES